VKTLKPIVVRDAWAEGLNGKLRRAFSVIYDPMLAMIDGEKLNSRTASALLRSLNSGLIRYKGGWFSGDFSAVTSKEIKKLGGRFDRVRRAWSLPAVKLPPELFLAASRSEQRFTSMFDGLLDVASDGNRRVMEYLESDEADFESEGDEIAEAVGAAFKKTVTDQIAVQPEITTEIRRGITKELTKTKTKPIRQTTIREAKQLSDQMGASARVAATNFADEEVVRLREKLEELIKAGKNIKVIRDYVQGRLNVSKKRAEFIARQETRLFTSALSVAQFKAAGITHYIWQATGDDRTRPLHKAHHGRKYAWDEAVIDERTGERGNPQESFGCRCVARPVVPGFE